MDLWWCGWNVPDAVPNEHMVERWPEGMKGWRTGYGDDYTTWVAVVMANTEEEAWNTILSCYGESAGEISERFGCQTIDPTKVGGDDRFPGKGRFVRGLIPTLNAMRRAQGEPEVETDSP